MLFYVSMQYSLKSKQEPPQWIVSLFCKAPPLTDLAAAFKDWNEHQRELCDSALLSEHYNCCSFPPDEKKSLAPFVPTTICKDFSKKHSGFSDTVHQSGGSNLPILLIFMIHKYLLWASGGWCDSGSRALQHYRPSMTVADCSTQNIYCPHWGEITASVLLPRSRKISWPGNT